MNPCFLQPPKELTCLKSSLLWLHPCSPLPLSPLLQRRHPLPPPLLWLPLPRHPLPLKPLRLRRKSRKPRKPRAPRKQLRLQLPLKLRPQPPSNLSGFIKKAGASCLFLRPSPRIRPRGLPRMPLAPAPGPSHPRAAQTTKPALTGGQAGSCCTPCCGRSRKQQEIKRTVPSGQLPDGSCGERPCFCE